MLFCSTYNCQRLGNASQNVQCSLQKGNKRKIHYIKKIHQNNLKTIIKYCCFFFTNYYQVSDVVKYKAIT